MGGHVQPLQNINNAFLFFFILSPQHQIHVWGCPVISCVSSTPRGPDVPVQRVKFWSTAPVPTPLSQVGLFLAHLASHLPWIEAGWGFLTIRDQDEPTRSLHTTDDIKESWCVMETLWLWRWTVPPSLWERRPLSSQWEGGLEVLLLAWLFGRALWGQPLYGLLPQRRHMHGFTSG